MPMTISKLVTEFIHSAKKTNVPDKGAFDRCQKAHTVIDHL